MSRKDTLFTSSASETAIREAVARACTESRGCLASPDTTLEKVHHEHIEIRLGLLRVLENGDYSLATREALHRQIDESLLLAFSEVMRRRTEEIAASRRHAEDERDRSLAEARGIQALNEELRRERDLRERFVATLTHDLKNPLSAAKVSSQLLARRPEQPPDTVAKYSIRAVNAIDRADRMINTLLDVTRIQAGESLPLRFETMDLRACVAEIIEDLSSVHGNRFSLVCELDRVEGTWNADGIQRVVENLVTNAVKYGAPARPVTISIEVDADWVRIMVHNEGDPIPPEETRAIFEAFRRSAHAQNSGKLGWGLGLVLVKGLVTAHAGKVRVESEASTGTRFTVELPWNPAISTKNGSSVEF